MNELQTISTSNLMLNKEAMAAIKEVAMLMAEGRATVPKHLQNSPADCMAICMQAAQWGMSPFAVGQKTHLINGTLGYEAQLVNAVISSSKAVVGRFKYEYGEWSNVNDSWVKVGAVLANEMDITWGEALFIGGITTKNSPLWKTAPKQQLAYLAVKYWARLYCPDVILGVYTADELQNREIDITAKGETLDNVMSSLKAKNNGKVEPQESTTVEEVQQDDKEPDSNTVDDFLKKIEQSTPETLSEIGQEIPKQGFTLEEMTQLREAYAARHTRL